MEEYKYLTITVLCYILALLWDLLKRKRDSEKRQTKFDIVFYLKDNLARLILSYLLSFLLAVVANLLTDDIAKIADQEWSSLNMIIYALIGAAPDLVISYAKRKVDFLQ